MRGNRLSTSANRRYPIAPNPKSTGSTSTICSYPERVGTVSSIVITIYVQHHIIWCAHSTKTRRIRFKNYRSIEPNRISTIVNSPNVTFLTRAINVLRAEAELPILYIHPGFILLIVRIPITRPFPPT